MIIIAFVVGLHFISRLNQPALGVTNVSQGTVDNQNISFSVSLTPKLQNTKYASYDYPSGLNLKTGTPIYPPSVATLDYTVKDVESWFLAVDISSNPSGNLSNNSAYLGRIDNPSEFHQSNTNINGQPVIIITDTQAEGFSQIAFLVHDTWLATVSLIGDDVSGTQPLQTSFNMILQTWHWLV